MSSNLLKYYRNSLMSQIVAKQPEFNTMKQYWKWKSVALAFWCRV